MSDFNPTVDLRQNTQKPEPKPFQSPPARPEPQPAPPPKTSPLPPPRPAGTPPRATANAGQAGGERRAQGEGKRLPRELEVEDQKEFQRINKPVDKPASRSGWKAWVIIALLLSVAGSYYWFIYQPKHAIQPIEQKWYMVKLTDAETFYGQIGDNRADPVVISKVYYDYDQLQKKENGTASSTDSGQAGSIRLVKRGKETHGPDGTLNVVRSQVLYMEPLAAESKVLKAIEEYEKQGK